MAHEPIGPLLAQWVEATRGHLTNRVNRTLVMPGASVVEDDCCEGGGQLHIRVISIVGVGALSNPNSQPCNPLYQVRVGLGTRRCAHTVDDNGVPPSPAEMTADALLLLQDRADLMEAIVCSIAPTFHDRNDIATLRIEDWLPSNILGGCMGTEITFTFNQVLCAPCPEEDPA